MSTLTTRSPAVVSLSTVMPWVDRGAGDVSTPAVTRVRANTIARCSSTVRLAATARDATCMCRIFPLLTARTG